MKVKRFSTARDKELKCTDPESYIDENGILYPRLTKMPIQDLSLIANFRVETTSWHDGFSQKVAKGVAECDTLYFLHKWVNESFGQGSFFSKPSSFAVLEIVYLFSNSYLTDSKEF